MCMTKAEYEALASLGSEKYYKIRGLQNDKAAQLRRESDRIRNMDARDYEKEFLAPPDNKVTVRKWDADTVEGVLRDAKAGGGKAVFIDIRMDGDGHSQVVVVDEKGAVVDSLLTFAPDGVVNRHQNIQKELGLALSKDGSLRGRLA